MAPEIVVQQPVGTPRGQTSTTAVQKGSQNSGQWGNTSRQSRNSSPTRLEIIRENRAERDSFLSLEPIASQVPKENPQIEYIPINGENSPIGVEKARLIRSNLLVTS